MHPPRDAFSCQVPHCTSTNTDSVEGRMTVRSSSARSWCMAGPCRRENPTQVRNTLDQRGDRNALPRTARPNPFRPSRSLRRAVRNDSERAFTTIRIRCSQSSRLGFHIHRNPQSSWIVSVFWERRQLLERLSDSSQHMFGPAGRLMLREVFEDSFQVAAGVVGQLDREGHQSGWRRFRSRTITPSAGCSRCLSLKSLSWADCKRRKRVCSSNRLDRGASIF